MCFGNEKGLFENLEVEWGRGIIDYVWVVVEDMVCYLLRLFYVGFDIVVDWKGNFYVLEVNFFGDFFKEIFVGGKNIYELELLYW